jgi:hypothetical protein
MHQPAAALPGAPGLLNDPAAATVAAQAFGQRQQGFARPASARPSFIAPTLLNGWTNLGAGNNPAGYMIDSDGFVHLRGVIASGALAASAFALPVGYRPANAENLAVVSNSAFGYLAITAAGAVMPMNGSAVWFSLDGVSFRAA